MQFRVRDLCLSGMSLVTRGTPNDLPYIRQVMRCTSPNRVVYARVEQPFHEEEDDGYGDHQDHQKQHRAEN